MIVWHAMDDDDDDDDDDGENVTFLPFWFLYTFQLS
jgi:hypothetical protein